MQAAKEEALRPSGAQPPTLLSRRLQGRCSAVGTPVLPCNQEAGSQHGRSEWQESSDVTKSKIVTLNFIGGRGCLPSHVPLF